MTGDEVLIVAGEASGDQHAARLLSELRNRYPELRAFGLGAEELRAAGMETLADSSEIAVVGLVEILKILRRARQIFHQILDEVDRRGTRTAILVDFPEFNLRLARDLKRRGIKVIYYISPQVWAWRRRRVKTIAKRVDLMLVLFPFEVEFYEGHGVRAVHVGHPLVDEVVGRGQAWDQESKDGEPFRIVLMPGSRRSEVDALLPVMAPAIRLLRERFSISVSLIKAPGISVDHLRDRFGEGWESVQLIQSDRFDSIANSHLAICASGTATLEVGLLVTPTIVVYRLASWTWLAAKLLVDLPNVSLVNLVLGREVVPELLQKQAVPDRIARECVRLLGDREAIREMRQGLRELRPALGASGASRRAAEEVLAVMGRSAA